MSSINLRDGRHTASPSLHSAATSVPPPSLSRSMASSTSTNFPLPSNIFSRFTHSALRFSVLAYGLLSIFSSYASSNASREAATTRSSRCRVVMHSRTLTMAWGVCKRRKYARRMDDLPVAVKPCTLTKDGEGRCAWPVSGAPCSNGRDVQSTARPDAGFAVHDTQTRW